MAAKKTPEPAVTITLADPEDPGKVTAITEAPEPSEWDALKPAIPMPNRVTVGDIKPNALSTVHAFVRELAEKSLAINTKAVAAKRTSNANRPRVNYHWDVQPLPDSELAAKLDKQLNKYAKYRPSKGDIPFKDDVSPLGQVTVRTGNPGWFKLGDDGVPVACGEKDGGAFYGMRYSVRPREQRNTPERLPGTA